MLPFTEIDDSILLSFSRIEIAHDEAPGPEAISQNLESTREIYPQYVSLGACD